MFSGTLSVCLRVEDLPQAVRFYTALGFTEVEGGMAGRSAVMPRGSARLFLMNFGADSLNFRGADAFAVKDHLQRLGESAPGEPESQDDGGDAWLTEDPAGHMLFFNTHAQETTAEHRQAEVVRILHGAVQDLTDVGADASCVAAMRSVAERFG